ncbi:hypothetical protein ILUMI_03398 [Ignelater luminosus]|uniref:Uncharacterized protein n=1 Tax=Ignelater luminosus TaxID=2038154 RepID=A0A8K0GFJ2_IGNLU|nr:hypothetical protein ILUMI_03398 [Ignelater luminosus]
MESWGFGIPKLEALNIVAEFVKINNIKPPFKNGVSNDGGKHLADEEHAFEGTAYFAGPRSWMETDIFFNGVHETLIPTLEAARPVLPTSHGYSSHINVKLIELVRKGGIYSFNARVAQKDMYHPERLKRFQEKQKEGTQERQQELDFDSQPEHFTTKRLGNTLIYGVVQKDMYHPERLKRFQQKQKEGTQKRLEELDVDSQPEHVTTVLDHRLLLPDLEFTKDTEKCANGRRKKGKSSDNDLICIDLDKDCNPEMYEEDNEDQQQEVAPAK